MKKRLLSGLLVLVMVLTMLPVSVLAEGHTHQDLLTNGTETATPDCKCDECAVAMHNRDENGICLKCGAHTHKNEDGTDCVCDFEGCDVPMHNRDANGVCSVCNSHTHKDIDRVDCVCDVEGCDVPMHERDDSGVCTKCNSHTHKDIDRVDCVCDVEGCDVPMHDRDANNVCSKCGNHPAHIDENYDGKCDVETCKECMHKADADGFCKTADCPHVKAGLDCCKAKPVETPTVKTYEVTAYSGKNGSVTRDGETVYVTEDSDYTIWFYPKKGYEVSAVYVNGLLVNYNGICYTHHWDCTGCHDCDWIDWSHWYDCDYYWCDHDHCWYDHDYCDDCWYDHYYCDYYYGPIYWGDWQDGITLYDIDRDYTVYVEFAAIDSGCPSDYYYDLDTDAWYHEATDFVIEKGLMKGVAYKTFDPEGITTRGELITMLYRLAGEPKVTGTSEFTDVKAGQWYTDAILWATKKGIVEGHGHTRFGVEDVITREETVTILYRYAKAKNANVTKLADLDTFVDAEKVSDFAETPFGWAVQKGIVNGDTTSNGKLKLNPQGNTLRVEMAAMVMRFAKLVG